MTEITIRAAGPFGYVAQGLAILQVMLLTNGGVHTVAYTGTGNKTVPGTLLVEFNPEKEKFYTYSQVRRALQKARTEERLYGTMSLVGAAGSMTRFGIELGRMKSFSTHEWIKKLTFEGIDPTQVEANCILMYAEVNAD